MLSLGQELKRAREERGITLHEIANSTHIGVRFLQAIESDSYDILPGGVFNRAFVRKFARHVSYDEEQAIKLYEEQLEEMGGEPQRRYYTGIDDLESKPTSGNGLLFSLLALIILGAGAYLAYEYFKTPPAISVSQVAITTTPSPAPTATPNPNVSPIGGSDATTTSGSMKLQLIANNKDCWVKVYADTEEPEEAMLRPGDVRDFNANEKFVLYVGNIPALRMTINGREINITKLVPNQKGAVARNVLITKENYQQYIN